MEGKIIEYFEGKMSRGESADFLCCVESDKDLKKLFINAQNAYALIRTVPEKKDHDEGKTAYEQFMLLSRRRNMRRIFVRSMAYAAAIALLMIATWQFAGKSDSSGRTSQVYTPAGQRSKITLDDGSVVWLNARSTLAYHSDFSRNRQVQLTGEAFFEVAEKHGKPFTVAANGVNITALGTKFNVSSYPENDKTQIALMEGSVKVWNDEGQELILQPGQQAQYCENRLTRVPIEHLDYSATNR